MSSSKDPWAGGTQAGPAGRDEGKQAGRSPGILKVWPKTPGGAYSSWVETGSGEESERDVKVLTPVWKKPSPGNVLITPGLNKTFPFGLRSLSRNEPVTPILSSEGFPNVPMRV